MEPLLVWLVHTKEYGSRQSVLIRIKSAKEYVRDHAGTKNMHVLEGARLLQRDLGAAMCFSATASFAAAALTGSIGFACLSRTRDRRQWPLAAMPLFFALQQTLEGALWLTLPIAVDAPLSSGLTLLYLLFAQTFWPIYAPVAALLAEADVTRRRLMCVCTGVGTAVSSYLLWGILARSHGAAVVDAHIVYFTETPIPFALGFVYLAATALPMLLSSQKVLVWFGVVVSVGCVTANVFYWAAFASVWCFFAAVSSAMLLFHFELARRSPRLQLRSQA